MKNRKPSVEQHKLVTRRDFIAQGLAQASGYVLVPSLIGGVLGSKSALAANCPAGNSPAGLLPLIVIDMAGGAGLHANFVVGRQGGALDYLGNYSTMGVPFLPGNTPSSVNTEFGAPMWTTVSKIRAGMITNNMSNDARSKTSMITVCHTAADDSKGNMLSPVILASKAGLAGSVLKTGVALGGNSPSPINDSSLRPFQIKSPTSLRDLFGYGSITSLDSNGSKAALSAAIHKLGQLQAPLVQSLANAPALSNAFECAHLGQAALVGDLGFLDARLDPAVQAVYGVTQTSVDNNSVRAAIVYHALKGHSGPGVLQIGGCDYHTGNRTDGNAKDLEIGRELGRILELARRLGKGVVVVGITDGSVYSNPAVLDAVTGELAWVGDAGAKGLSFMACYKPEGKPPVVRSQIGHFLDNSNPGADRGTFFGSNQALVANILFANYLQLCDRMDLFDVVVPQGSFPRSELPDILGFG